MNTRSKQTAAALMLLAAAIAFRIITGFADSHLQWLPNFAPVAAIALCGAIYLPRRLAVVLPLAILFLSDIVLNFHYHTSLVAPEMVSRYIALGLVVALGCALRGRAPALVALPASLVGSAVFYLVTNTGSWISDVGYAKTFAGWVQALTTGLPGYAPTWMFYRNTLVSDLLFTALFVACFAWTARRLQSPVLHESRAV